MRNIPLLATAVLAPACARRNDFAIAMRSVRNDYCNVFVHLAAGHVFHVQSAFVPDYRRVYHYEADAAI